MMIKINKLTQEQGFTLIELIIVVVILGILAAVGIPRFMNSRAEAEANTCKANRSSLDDAVERYHFDNAGWPGTQKALVDGAYIKREFECPTTNSTSVYSFANASTGITCTNHP
jgi:type II secretion system protein G